MANGDLPPIGALRAFDVAARERSFTRAANALGVTQASVSLQIRALEDFVGVQLFIRGNNGVGLTTAGEELQPIVARSLSDVGHAITRLRSRSDSSKLTISVFSSFAARWLVVRLGDFLSRNPTVELRLDSSNRIVDLEREDFDLCIRFGAGSWADARSERFMAEALVPVCSPHLLARFGGQFTEVLERAVLLEDQTCDGQTDGWAQWFAHNQPKSSIHRRRRTIFSDSSLLIQAAVEGQGVALGRLALVASDLQSGRLVRMEGATLDSPYAYFLCTPKHRPSRKKATKRLIAWLRAQAAIRPAMSLP